MPFTDTEISSAVVETPVPTLKLNADTAEPVTVTDCEPMEAPALKKSYSTMSTVSLAPERLAVTTVPEFSVVPSARAVESMVPV